MNPLDLINRADSFVGDPDKDDATLFTPPCYTCKNKIDVHTCSRYPEGIPISIITGGGHHAKIFYHLEAKSGT